VKSIRPVKYVREISCPLCDAMKFNSADLLNHLVRAHKINNIDELSKYIQDVSQCQICLRYFCGPKGLSFHIIKNHKDISLKEYYDRYLKTKGDGECKICGQLTKFISIPYGYNQYCSNECVSKSEIVKEKRINTLMNHYGVDNPMKSKIVVDKLSTTFNERYGVDFYVQTKEFKDKYKHTCLEKYGVEHSSYSDEILGRIRETNISRYGGTGFASDELYEKVKHTCLERYGFEHASQSEEIQRKIHQTNIDHFGMHFSQTSEARQMYRENFIRMIENEKLNGETLCGRVGDMERPCLNEIQIHSKFEILRNVQLIGYIPDGRIEELKLIIEFDEDHHNQKWCKFKDNQKDCDLMNKGYQIFRIKKCDWMENPNQIINEFKQLMKELEC